MTPAQLELQQKHGTVEEFTDAVINAIGEISVMEAQAAIAKYRQQWKEAGERSPAMNQWIKVSERLPSMNDGDVLFYSKMGGYEIGEYDGRSWNDKGGCLVAGVTHWMPLPEDPVRTI